MLKLRVFLILALLFFSISLIYASCEEGQVDINSASAEELDSIAQIGPARAEQMITLRPFSSVDDMIRIVGIGETNINLIKSQGLACVDDEGIAKKKYGEENNSVNIKAEVNIDININSTSDSNSSSSSIKETQFETINLNPKAIKSDVDSEVSSKRNYAIYGLIAFGVLLGLLFLIKNFIRKKYKNEFT